MTFRKLCASSPTARRSRAEVWPDSDIARRADDLIAPNPAADGSAREGVAGSSSRPRQRRLAGLLRRVANFRARADLSAGVAAVMQRQGVPQELLGLPGTRIVADNTREMSLSATPPPVIYEPLADDAQSFLKVIVRTAGDPQRSPSRSVPRWRTLDPGLPVDALQPMRQMMAESVATQRFYATLVAIFAGSHSSWQPRASTRSSATASSGAPTSWACASLGRGRRPGAATRRGSRRGLALLGIVLGAGGAIATTRVLRASCSRSRQLDPVTS